MTGPAEAKNRTPRVTSPYHQDTRSSRGKEIRDWKYSRSFLAAALLLPAVQFCSPGAPCEERDYKGLHAFPFNITRDEPPITRDFPPSLLILQGMTLQLQGIPLPPF